MRTGFMPVLFSIMKRVYNQTGTGLDKIKTVPNG